MPACAACVFLSAYVCTDECVTVLLLTRRYLWLSHLSRVSMPLCPCDLFYSFWRHLWINLFVFLLFDYICSVCVLVLIGLMPHMLVSLAVSRHLTSGLMATYSTVWQWSMIDVCGSSVSGAEGLTVILLITLTSRVCVSVRVHLHDCDADFSRLICAQGAKCSCLFGAVYFTKCSV